LLQQLYEYFACVFSFVWVSYLVETIQKWAYQQISIVLISAEQ
jgi:hypothetical protein